MMVQTERLSPDAAGCEIRPVFAHQNVARQTCAVLAKEKKKP